MSEVTTSPEAAPTREATIHDAIESLFATKAEAPAPVVEAAPSEEATAETSEPAPEAAPVETPPAKVSAADYAIQLARAKKIAAKAAAATPAQAMPSAEIIKRAAAIEAAGGNPIKIMEAAGIDLAAAVRAYENEAAANPKYTDPLEAKVAELAAKLAQYEGRDRASEDAKAVTSFFDAADKTMKASGDKFEYVAAYGGEGLELVKELVLEAAKGGEVLPLAKALEMAESHYSAEADKLAKTKKLAAKFQPQTRKPGIAQQAPAAGAAPANQTKSLTVSDVINESIDALLG